MAEKKKKSTSEGETAEKKAKPAPAQPHSGVGTAEHQQEHAHEHAPAHPHTHDEPGHVHGPDCDHDHDHDHDHGHEHHHGQEPIKISAEALTAEAKKLMEEQSGKPVVDLAYKLVEQKPLPNAVQSLEFEVAAEVWSGEVACYYEKLRKEVVLPGFRKGKAPIKLIRIRMGEDADKDAMSEVATNVLRQEVIKQSMNLITDPQLVAWTIEEGKPLHFGIHAEIQPNIELKEYKGLEVEVEAKDSDDSAVDAELERLRNDFAVWESVAAGHKLTEGDSVVVDVTVTGDKGQELKHLGRENWLATNWKSQFPEEVAKALEGKSAGDIVEVSVTSQRESRKGDAIESTDKHTVKIRDIKQRKLPNLDDEFAKDTGEHQTLDELKAAIKKNLAEGDEGRKRAAAIAEITKSIIIKNPFDAPRSFIANERYRSIMEEEEYFRRMGLRLDQIIGDGQKYLAYKSAEASFRVKQAYIFSKLAEMEKLEVTDADLEKEIEQMAEKSGRKPLAIRAKLEAEKRLDGLKSQLLDRKLADFLIGNNKVKYVEPKTPAPEAEEPKAE